MREAVSTERLLDGAGAGLAPPILESKLRVPELRPGIVPRRKLLDKLARSTDFPLVMVTAAAGYGKSSALAQWATTDQRAFAWLSLTADDDDPVALLTQLAVALDRVEPVDPSVFLALAVTGHDQLHRSLVLLRNSVREFRRPFVLVLDDVHLLSDPLVLEVIERITEDVPTGSQVAIASRVESQLPLGRLRAARMLAEFDRDDLAMDAHEAAQLLRLAGVELAQDDLTSLVDRTEGWPAALYLAALATRDGTHDRPLHQFAGDDRRIADFMAGELLASHDDQLLQFMVDTSVLDKLSGPLCDEVCEMSGSQALLEQLARTNLLVIPLDSRDQWFRYHHLLEDELRARLRRDRPQLERSRNERAGRWYDRQGDHERAIRHLLAAGEVERAGDILWRVSLQYHVRGWVNSLHRWQGYFTEAQIAAYAPLAVAAGWNCIDVGDQQQVEYWLAAAESAGWDGLLPCGSATLESTTAMLRAALAKDGVAQMLEDGERAYASFPGDGPWRTFASYFLGAANQMLGRRDVARHHLERAVREAGTLIPNINAICSTQLAWMAADEGDWDKAAAQVGRVREVVVGTGLSEYPVSALTFALSGMVRAKRGEGEAARADLALAARLRTTLEGIGPWLVAQQRLTVAQTWIWLNDMRQARAELDEVPRFLSHAPDAVVLTRRYDQMRSELSAIAPEAASGAALTSAEARVLGYLPTHLSLREIAERLHVSPNTVRTQAKSIYRKLDASSRSEAVSNAAGLGLLASDQQLDTV